MEMELAQKSLIETSDVLAPKPMKAEGSVVARRIEQASDTETVQARDGAQLETIRQRLEFMPVSQIIQQLYEPLLAKGITMGPWKAPQSSQIGQTDIEIISFYLNVLDDLDGVIDTKLLDLNTLKGLVTAEENQLIDQLVLEANELATAVLKRVSAQTNNPTLALKLARIALVAGLTATLAGCGGGGSSGGSFVVEGGSSSGSVAVGGDGSNPTPSPTPSVEPTPTPTPSPTPTSTPTPTPTPDWNDPAQANQPLLKSDPTRAKLRIGGRTVEESNQLSPEPAAAPNDGTYVDIATDVDGDRDVVSVLLDKDFVHVNSGNWTSEGVKILGGPGAQDFQKNASLPDGSKVTVCRSVPPLGGNGKGQIRLQTQRADTSIVFPIEGLLVSGPLGDHQSPRVCVAPSGLVHIFWQTTGGPDGFKASLRHQVYSPATQELAGPTSGWIVEEGADGHRLSDVKPHPIEGVVVAWDQKTGGLFHPFHTQVTDTNSQPWGAPVPLYTGAEGLAPRLAIDGVNNAIYSTWEGVDGTDPSNIFVHKVDATTGLKDPDYGTNGVRATSAAGIQRDVSIDIHTDGTPELVWEDLRDELVPAVYRLRLNPSDGSPDGTANGDLLATVAASAAMFTVPEILTDGNRSHFLWGDRTGSATVRYQNVNPNGTTNHGAAGLSFAADGTNRFNVRSQRRSNGKVVTVWQEEKNGLYKAQGRQPYTTP